MIILLCGKAGSGKTTVEEYIKNNYNIKDSIALADKLKIITYKLLKLFNIEINDIEDLYNDNKHKYRNYLQQIGTDICRNELGENVWCEATNQTIKSTYSKNNVYIISDIRFENEIKYFKKKYGNNNVVSIMIKRECCEQLNHSSEECCFDTNFIVNNNYRMYSLRKYIDYILMLCDINKNNKEGFKQTDIKLVLPINREINDDDINDLNKDVESNCENKDVESNCENKDVESNCENKDVESNCENKDVESNCKNKDVESNCKNKDVESNCKNKDVESNCKNKDVESNCKNKDVESNCENKDVESIIVWDQFEDSVKQNNNNKNYNNLTSKTSNITTPSTPKSILKTDSTTKNVSKHITFSIPQQPSQLEETYTNQPSQSQLEEMDNIVTLNPTIIYAKEIPRHQLTISSQQKGVIGEDNVVEMLKSISNKLEITKVSSTGHMGDIHVIDYSNNIQWIVEVKLKQSVNKNDVDKFISDVENIKTKITNKRIIGLFLSLDSDNIPSIGKLSISTDLIYLTKSYISIAILELLFKYIIYLNKPTTQQISSSQLQQQYTFSENVINIIARIKYEYTSIVNEKNMLISIQEHNSEISSLTNKTIHQLELKEEFIKLLNIEFSNITPYVEQKVNEKSTTKLKEYLKKKHTKKDIIAEFPEFSTEFASMTIKKIYSTYANDE